MSNSSQYGYTTLNYKSCCPTYIPIIKTMIQSQSESEHLLKLNSCCSKYVKPKNVGVKHGSYDRVLRRRRGQAFQQ